MNPSLALVLALLAATATAGFAWIRRAERRWNAATAAFVKQLVDAAVEPAPTTTRTDADLDTLPASVARYLRSVLPEPVPLARHVRVAWRGEFNLGKPGADRWVPFTAIQDFVPAAPGFVWAARMRMAPGITVFVRDGFVAGEGRMKGAVLGLVIVVDAKPAPALARAALTRYLGETLWFPTALLPGHGVIWEAIDAELALATLVAGDVRASLEFRFDADGRVASVFTPERLFDDGKNPPVLRPWQARIDGYAQHAGTWVPRDAVAEWLLPTGPFAYWRGTATSIEVR